MNAYFTARSEFHPGIFETQALRVWHTPGRNKYKIGINARTGLGVHSHALPISFDAPRRVVELERYAFGLEVFGNKSSNTIVESAKKHGPSVEKLCLHSQAMEDASELDGDIASPNNQRALRKAVERKGIIGCNCELPSRPVRHKRATTGGDENPLPCKTLLPNFNPMRVKQSRRTMKDYRARRFKQFSVYFV